jgi:hypothetical protein
MHKRLQLRVSTSARIAMSPLLRGARLNVIGRWRALIGLIGDTRTASGGCQATSEASTVRILSLVTIPMVLALVQRSSPQHR